VGIFPFRILPTNVTAPVRALGMAARVARRTTPEK
jgi:hypothetical protein